MTVLRPLLAACLTLFSLCGAAMARDQVDAFFDGMAIAVAPGQQSQFVVGDNLAGYFEGYTQSYGRGEGYVTRAGVPFQNYATFVNGRLNQRNGARELVLPYGHQVSYPDGVREEMALLSRRHAFALRVTSARPALLAIAAILPQQASPALISHNGEVLVVAPATPGGSYLALAADQPVQAGAGLALHSVANTTALTVIAAFGASAEQAIERARALCQGDPIRAERAAMHAELTKSTLVTSDAHYNKALNWAKAASRLFVVEEFGSGIWAGLPWFRDNWGRDTFIALPGTLLVSGQFAQARAVLSNFARYQNLAPGREYGRIPNRVAAGDSIIYNTVDGTPWMLREGLEYLRYTGDRAFAEQLYRLALPYFEGAIANYMDQQGLLTHDDADTWMDARIDGKDAWSPRGPRAVEIQALWYTALQSGAALARQAGDEQHANAWSALAARVQANFLPLFWDGKTMADRLRADASRDTRVRPNQLMLLSIPFDAFVPEAVQAQVLKNAVSELLYPYGIASLSQHDPDFHPRHVNPGYHHKDAAYHQGTVWGWNAGFTVTGLNKFGYQDLAWDLSRNLGEQILQLGTLGNMSELLDALPGADGKPTPSGTFAQSWSVAEYARNGFQDYVGFRPDLLSDTLAFTPAIPAAWRHFHAVLPFAEQAMTVDFARHGAHQRWRLRIDGSAARNVSFDVLQADRSRARLHFTLAPGSLATLELDGRTARLDGRLLTLTPSQASYLDTIGTLRFATPLPYRPQDFPALRGRDILKARIEHKDYH